MSEYTPERIPCAAVITTGDVARIAYADARARGWHDGVGPSDSDERDAWMMIIMTEWAAAAEMVTGNPEGLGAELADVVIRAAEMIGATPQPSDAWTSASLREMQGEEARGGDITITSILARMYRGAKVRSLSGAIEKALGVAEWVGIDLASEVVSRMHYNRSRMRRHGGDE